MLRDRIKSFVVSYIIAVLVVSGCSPSEKSKEAPVTGAEHPVKRVGVIDIDETES